MSELARMADQLERAYRGSAWHGPSLLEALEDVDFKKAFQHPLHDAHSIWEIVLHVTSTNETVTMRLMGMAAMMTPEEDWPSIDTSDAGSWQAALEKLSQSHNKLIDALKTVSEDRLDDPVIKEFSTIYVTIQGNIQHMIYHAGQIMLLKKQ
ncbi:DinB family protein [Bacillus sp. FJAT-42376]|uniref:DinB family protein n=1 Tax=Bacillus sp. FJAT-42376 TaxID=2014076 RepID=UPI0013DDDD5C|nr:DinB family protein [Bacillus sp. FJAT-42376]